MPHSNFMYLNIKEDCPMSLVDDWKKVYDFQLESNDFPFSNGQKCITINVWEASGVDKKDGSLFSSMFAYAEVLDPADGEAWNNTFFGESCGDDAFRWATDKANKELY